MATSTPLSERPPEETNNPGQDEYNKLAQRTDSAGDRDNQAAGDASAPGSEPSLDQLSANERNGGNDSPTTHVYRPGDLNQISTMKPSVRGVVGFARTKRGKIVIGGASAGLATLLIIGFFSLFPFKILHILDNLQSHFFSTGENALSNETDVLFSDYIKKYVLPGLNTCRAGRTIDKSCTPRAIQGNSIISKLYTGWRRAKLENTMAEKYGIEFAKVGSNYYVKLSGLSGNGAKLDDNFTKGNESLDQFFQNSSDPQIKKVSRSELRAAVSDALDNETFFKKTWYRFKVGGLLEQKYGIKRCIVACTAQDNFADWKNNKKLAAKAYLIDRVIAPRSASLSIVLKCLLAGTGDSGACSINSQPTATECSGDCELNGEQEAKWESDLRSELATYRQTLGTKSAQTLIDEVNAIRDKGYTSYLFEKVFSGIASSDGQALAGRIQEDPAEAKNVAQAAQFAEKLGELSKSASIVGTIDTIANIFHSLSNSGPLLSKLTYVTNAQTMVAEFSMYRTYADEIKTGNVDATIVGSFTDSLSSGYQDPSDPNSKAQLGGTTGAEQAPLYANLFDSTNSNSGTVSFINSLLPGKALAATSSYTCANGQPVPAGKLVCDEESLNYNPVATNLTGAFSTEPLSSIKVIVDKFESIKNSFFGPILSVVNWTLGKLTSFITSVASLIPGVSNLENLATQLFDKLAGFLVAQVVPSPVASNVSGGRTFDLVAGGADVSGNDVAHHGLGGQELTPQQQAGILNDQQQLANAQYGSESFFGRMFDTQNNNSLITKLAMAMPSSFDDFRSSLASFMTNPFSHFSVSFSHAQAATSQADPFGVTQYGYPKNDPIFSQDPEQYWTTHCVDPGQEGSPQVSLAADKETYQWNASANLNSTNYMPENSTTNPCLLIESAVGSAGGLYDSSLLTQDDLADSNGSSQSGNQGGPTNPASGGWAWPTKISGAVITSCFGSRHGSAGGGYHPGTDIAQQEGSPVYAAQAGKVTFVGPASGYGNNFVIIEVSPTVHESYGHMDSATVKVGDNVTAGQQIGTVGNQGASSGPHLHFNLSIGTNVDLYNGNASPFQHGLTLPGGVSDPYNCVNYQYPGAA